MALLAVFLGAQCRVRSSNLCSYSLTFYLLHLTVDSERSKQIPKTPRRRRRIVRMRLKTGKRHQFCQPLPLNTLLEPSTEYE